MKDTSKKALRRGHNEGNIRRRTDGRWEVRLSAGIDYKTGKPRRTSTCCNTRQEAIAILQQQAHEVRTQGWRDPMSVTLGEWYEYWLNTYMKDTVKQSTYASYRSYLNKHFCALGKILLKKLEPHTLQEFYNYKFREEGLSPKTLRNYHMALHKCLQQAVKERLVYAVLFAKEPLFFHFVFDGHPFLLALASGSSHYWISFLYIVLFCKHFFEPFFCKKI